MNHLQFFLILVVVGSAVVLITSIGLLRRHEWARSRRTYPVAGGPQPIAAHSTGDEPYIASQAVGLEVLDPTTGTHTPVAGVDSGAVGLVFGPDGWSSPFE